MVTDPTITGVLDISRISSLCSILPSFPLLLVCNESQIEYVRRKKFDTFYICRTYQSTSLTSQKFSLQDDNILNFSLYIFALGKFLREIIIEFVAHSASVAFKGCKILSVSAFGKIEVTHV